MHEPIRGTTYQNKLRIMWLWLNTWQNCHTGFATFKETVTVTTTLLCNRHIIFFVVRLCPLTYTCLVRLRSTPLVRNTTTFAAMSYLGTQPSNKTRCYWMEMELLQGMLCYIFFIFEKNSRNGIWFPLKKIEMVYGYIFLG